MDHDRDPSPHADTATEADPAKSVAELMTPGTTLMVGTADSPTTWSFRPLTVARTTAGRIDILLDTDEQWVREFGPSDPVQVTLSDNRSNTWAELRGTAVISTDDELIDELWNPAAGAYFDDGRDSPGIGVFTIDVAEGRYWTAPSGRLGSLISMVKAKLGTPERAGEHGEIDRGTER